MKQKQGIDSLSELLKPHVKQVEADISLWLVEPGVPEALAEAMRYCVLGGGKRLRPVLVHLAGKAVGNDNRSELLRRSAVAVELAHCYSLVHDDLPVMDNDTLRRGRPTAHVQFSEAMAILVGDALLTRAIGVLAEVDAPGSDQLIAELTTAIGPAGMIAGQVADMGLCRVEEGPEGLRFVHLHKTAALIRGSARMGAICAGASKEQLMAISDYAENLGLAFQVIDDVLDVTGDAASLGKTSGKDAIDNKRTYVALFGLDRTIELGRELTEKAVLALKPLGEKGYILRRLAELLGERTR